MPDQRTTSAATRVSRSYYLVVIGVRSYYVVVIEARCCYVVVIGLRIYYVVEIIEAGI